MPEPPCGKPGNAREHHRPHRRSIVGGADAHRACADRPPLVFGKIVCGEPAAGVRAECGIDAVDGRAVRCRALDDRTRGRHTLACRGRQRHRCTLARDPHDVGERHALDTDAQRHGEGFGVSGARLTGAT